MTDETTPPDLLGAFVPFYSYVVRDASGVVTSSGRYVSDSFLIQFFRYLYCQMGITSALSAETFLNGSAKLIGCQSTANCEAAATNSSQGIVVGTNTGAVVFADSALRAQIAHGTASGQLQYGGSVVGQPASTALGTKVILTRDFSNASGASITIGEVGVLSDLQRYSGNDFNNLILRDTANILMTDGASLTFNYELQTLL